MDKEVIEKKLEQIKVLMSDLEKTVNIPFSDFYDNTMLARGAERCFQLIVDNAIDINSQLLVEAGYKTPDTYKESFTELGYKKIIDPKLGEILSKSAQIRNIIVHEYDIEEDLQRFYNDVKTLVTPFHEYLKSVYLYIR